MKIIVNTKKNGEECYVQVRDILFLGRITKNNKVIQQYINYINSGYGDNNFIKVVQPLYIKAFKNCDYIVDFTEYSSKNVSLGYLSKLLVTLNFSLNTDFDKKCIDHKTDDIRDIMAFKKGELDYKIPLVFNGDVEIINDDGTLCFESTILDDVFILKRTDGGNVKDIDYYSFYLNCINTLYTTKYSDIDVNDRNYSSFDSNGNIVITINSRRKKRSKKK